MFSLFPPYSIPIYTMDSHFLRLPIEIRRTIYRHIFPDQPIPATFERDVTLRSDGHRVNISILCTCRQTYEEAIEVLYGTVPFCVTVNEIAVFVAGVASRLEPLYGEEAVKRSSLFPEYQQQLTKLEKQNNNQLKQIYGTRDKIPAFVSRIKSFQVHISSHYYDKALASWAGPHLTQICMRTFDREIMDICDIVHNFVEFLKNRPQPVITRLALHIRLRFRAKDRRVVTAVTKLLLDPFIRLRGIADPTLESVSCPSKYELDPFLPCRDTVDLLAREGGINLQNYKEFRSYLAIWRKTIQSEIKPPPPFQKLLCWNNHSHSKCVVAGSDLTNVYESLALILVAKYFIGVHHRGMNAISKGLRRDLTFTYASLLD